MISAILFFFGATLIYTGFLAANRDLTIGLAAAFIGLVLIAKPALKILMYLRTHFFPGRAPGVQEKKQKVRTRKTHLKVVKSEDDKPTIH
jgi:hypothetical protein